MGKKYLSRVGTLIRYHITRLLLETSNDERLQQVTITDVVVNRDTTRAEVFYSILGPAEERVEVQAALDKAAGWLRSEMAPSLRLRNLPQLVFSFDPSLAHGDRIEALLNQLHVDGKHQPGAVASDADTHEGGNWADDDDWVDAGDDDQDAWDEDDAE